MKPTAGAAILAGIWLLVAAASVEATPVQPDPDSGISRLLRSLQDVAAAGQPDAYAQLLAPDADQSVAHQFANDQFRGRHSERVTVREEDRRPLDGAPSGEGYRLTLEALFESANAGRLATWRIDVRRRGPGTSWRIDAQRALSSFDHLYRLALDGGHEFVAHDLRVKVEDLELALPTGSVFVAATDVGPTALILQGGGEMVFSPASPADRGQIRLITGQDTLRTEFDSCFVRLNPGDLPALLSVDGNRSGAVELPAASRSGPVDGRALKRAEAVFADEAPRSYALDLDDLRPGPWSVLPSPGDVLLEIHTRRFGTLTYTRSMRDAEAIALFDRERGRYLALYAAKEQIASRGRFYSDDERADYAALHYDVEASFTPDRDWIEARSRMVFRVRAESLATFVVRLADPLVVRSVVADGVGRLLAIRVRGQNAVMVTLPEPLARGATLAVTIAYGGRLPPHAGQGEASAAQARSAAPPLQAPSRIAPSYLYSAGSAWYPQSPRDDYATATLRLTVPEPYTCVASGTLVATSKIRGASPGSPPATQFAFDTPRPLRYLACLITTLEHVHAAEVAPSFRLSVYANPRERGRATQVAAQAEDIARFYASLLGDYPYPDLTVAVLDNELPGGHSPAYLAILDEQVPESRLAWRNDPAGFPDFPEFFVAHEIAHQWWGQAIGEKNYHEEWLSEAFAQYFAALYAEHVRGRDGLAAMVRQMQRWTLRDSAKGPVYLGARVGQLQNDGQALRAVVYDKGALVLHMLRRLLGDDAFFRGVRLFYDKWRFSKAGSDDLRAALEQASGRRLGRFFDGWVYGDALPRLKVSWREARAQARNEIDLRVEQAGEPFDLPITITVDYSDRPAQDIVVPVTGPVVDTRVVVAGRVRRVLVNRDDPVPAQISR